MLSVANTLKKISPRFGIPAAMLIALFFRPDFAQVSLDQIYFPVGIALIFVGLYLRVWVRGYAREEGFVVDGPYRYVRNPVELGSTLLYLGIATSLGLDWWQLLVLIVVAIAYFETLALVNEETMKRALGERYDRYRSRVRRWIPSQHPGMNRSGVTFSVMRGLVQEKDFLFFLLVLVLCLIIKRQILSF